MLPADHPDLSPVTPCDQNHVVVHHAVMTSSVILHQWCGHRRDADLRLLGERRHLSECGNNLDSGRKNGWNAGSETRGRTGLLQ